MLDRLVEHLAKAEAFGQTREDPVIGLGLAGRLDRLLHQLHLMAAVRGHQRYILEDRRDG
ncbi:hypothetical protein D3C72_2545030 [compost metagenome]